jgi:hypothetical protein
VERRPPLCYRQATRAKDKVKARVVLAECPSLIERRGAFAQRSPPHAPLWGALISAPNLSGGEQWPDCARLSPNSGEVRRVTSGKYNRRLGLSI